MNRVSKILFVSATSVVLGGGIARADDPEPAQPEVGQAADAAVGIDSWPLAAIDRPLTAAKGMLEVTPMATLGHASIGDTSVDSEGATLAVRYGISSQLELGAAYTGVTFNPESNFKGALAAGLGYSAIRGALGGVLDVAPKAAVVYDFAGETAEIRAGADVHYKLSPRLYLGTPTNVPGLGVTVKGPDVMGTSVNPIGLAVPFAVGLQATPALQLQASTILANFSIKDSATTYVSDITPLTIDAIYALGHKMDIRVDLGTFDLQHAGDLLTIAAGINVRM